MFWQKKTKPKHGILYSYTFDNVKMNDEIVSAAPKEISQKIKLIKQNLNAKRYEVQKRWHLSNLPDMTLEEVDYQKDNLQIKAHIHFESITICPRPRLNWFQWLLLVSIIWFTVGTIGFIIYMNRLEEVHSINDPCTILFRAGKPEKLTIDTTEYPLNPDGTMNKETRIFLNPWHRQLVDSGQCKRKDIL